MSICWIVVGHFYMIRLLQLATYNYYDLANYFKKDKTAIIYGGEYGVDVFFWMSGFLMAYFFIGQLTRKSSLSYYEWFMVYFHRFFRILPAYMFTLFFAWSYIKYMGYGP
mmetsp:Transcript_14699/g.2421  ORF Transcript_14699/g.2421 Transcript_14699/m.2421 type:complete len:110 (+) Transcript_14699:104-433(+)